MHASPNSHQVLSGVCYLGHEEVESFIAQYNSPHCLSQQCEAGVVLRQDQTCAFEVSDLHRAPCTLVLTTAAIP